MQITIDIPQAFARHFEDDKFADSLKRLKSDAHGLAGEYEKELMDMLAEAFEHSRVETEKDETESTPPTPPHPRWKPEEDEKYYMVCGDGTPYLWHWHGCCDDGTSINRYTIGNVFHTKDEAAFVGERLRVLAEMREWAGNSNDGAYIFYHRPTDQIITNWDSVHYHGDIRFKSINDAENCIKAVGKDRIKKYYFMIPDFNN